MAAHLVEADFVAAKELPEVPFRGLEPFRYIDSPIFFARRREVRKLLRNITMYRGVLFYGDSGSGKSSLINAGLIPKIIEEGFTVDRVRVQPRANEELIIERIPMVSQEGPPFLKSSFVDMETEPGAARLVFPVAEVRSKLAQLQSSARPLLIFDQFEEIVTLFEEGSQPRAQEKPLDIQTSILDVLVELISDHSLPVKVLIVFREDYLAKLTKLFIRCPDLPDYYLRLTAPNKQSLHDVIRGPFERFPQAFAPELSEDLCAKLVAEIEQGNESELINLSEVQICCLKLWQASNPSELLGKRGVEGLLEDFLSESLTKLPADMREPAVALLRRMVTSSGTRNVISEDDLVYLAQREEKISPAILRKALNSLTQDTKLIRREQRQNTFFYQIVSEFLIPWIRRQKEEQRIRLQKRRAYRYVAMSLAVALAAAMLAYWVFRTRTTQVLKDKAVQEAIADTRKAQAKVQELQKEVQNLRAIISGDQSKAAINNFLQQRDLYKQQSERTQVDLDLAKARMQALTAQLDTLQKQVENQGLQNEAFAKATTLNKDLTDENTKLSKEMADVKENLRKANEALKAKESPPVGSGTTLSGETAAGVPERKGEVSEGWEIVQEQRVKDTFGSKINDQYLCIQVTVRNGLEKSIRVRNIGFRPENSEHIFTIENLQVVLASANNAQQQAQLFRVGFDDKMIIGWQQAGVTFVFVRRGWLSGPRTTIESLVVKKQLGSLVLAVEQFEVTKMDPAIIKPSAVPD